MMIWSRIGISISWQTFCIRSVSSTSSRLGLRFPDGWLWKSIIHDALLKMLVFKISLGCATDEFNVPRLTKFILIGFKSFWRFTTTSASRSNSFSVSFITRIAASGLMMGSLLRSGGIFTMRIATCSSLYELLIGLLHWYCNHGILKFLKLF